MPEDYHPVESRSKRSLDIATTAEKVGTMRTLVNRVALTWRLFLDGRVHLLTKALPLGALIYLISPIDLIPLVAALGVGPLVAVDDIGVILLALTAFIQLAPPDVVKEHLRELGEYIPIDDDLYPDEDIVDGYAQPYDE